VSSCDDNVDVAPLLTRFSLFSVTQTVWRLK